MDPLCLCSSSSYGAILSVLCILQGSWYDGTRDGRFSRLDGNHTHRCCVRTRKLVKEVGFGTSRLAVIDLPELCIAENAES